ncbi:MAG: type II secretion system protein GspM [Allosphingosinicella sp.]
MSGRFAELWRARTPRERWLLAVMGVLLAFVLVWLLVLRPLGDMLSQARERHGLAVAELAEARQRAGAIAELEGHRPAPVAGPLDAFVAQSASAAGFQLSRLQPQGEGRVSIALDSARPQALFGWIAQLEGQGLLVETFDATANPDRTLGARILLRTRAR